MATSIGKGRQPDNSEQEQQEGGIRLRRRQRRTLQKQLFGQEVTPIPLPSFPSPKRILRRTILPKPQAAIGARPHPEPPKSLLARQTGMKSSVPIRSSVQPLRPVPDIKPRRPAKMPHESTLPPNFVAREHRTQESEYRREQQPSVSSAQMNPWQVQPKSPSLSPQSLKAGSQTPKSVDVNREGSGRTRAEVSVFSRFNLPHNLSKRRQSNTPSRKGVNTASPVQEGKATGRRVRPKTGSQPSPSQTPRKVQRPPKRPLHPLVYIIRLLILGIGIGAIAGTLLSALDPASHASVKGNPSPKTQVQESPQPLNQRTPLALNQEILPLKSQIQTLIAKNPKLQPGVFIVDLDTGGYIDLGSQATVPAASTIKLPILVALFQEVDAGKIRLDESLTLQSEMLATGSGDLQYKKPGTKFTVLELATKMIAISDNTATNMIIARLGGTEALTQRFRSWGLTTTDLRNALPDLEGMNVTSPKELSMLMAIVNQGQLVSLPSRDRIFSIMQNNQINNLLPQGLGTGAIIAHKTGNIGSLLADVGLVNMPSGKSYIISVMVKRPFNDSSAQELIREISQTAYTYFNQPAVSPSTSAFPSESTASTSVGIGLDN